jgi:LPXTG-motif cell wall-anchored protein
MTRPIWAMIANHYTKRRGLSATNLTQIAAKAAPEGGGGDYGPNSGGYDQLGFGTLLFTRDKATQASATASPTASASASASTSASASASAAASPAGGTGSDLADTGASDIAAWTAATGITALAGGLLLLRKRGRSSSNSTH